MIDIESALEALREPAPGTLLPAVLAATGLADRFVRRPSPLGEVYVAFGERGVTALALAGDPDDFSRSYEHRTGRPVVPAGPVPDPVMVAIDRAIEERRPAAIDVDLSSLTDFQAAVLRATAGIPSGEVRPYGWVAREIGKPGAVRAVGSALARNPVPLIIPCHRVVRSDGRLGEYSLGEAANKPLLLHAEGVDVTRLQILAERGTRLVGSDTTRIFCLPTCRHARRISTAHLREFRSDTDARRSGYRPCMVCRPVAAA